jgi:hypothetical protein
MPSSVEDPVTSLKTIPGGDDLLALFGGAPDFGDAEILDLHLDRVNPSVLRVHEMYKDIIVTFSLEEIIGLKLDDFSPQNVIDNLELQLVHVYPKSFNIEWLHPPKPRLHYDLKLESIYGIGGLIRARRVSISLRPPLPDERRRGSWEGDLGLPS